MASKRNYQYAYGVNDVPPLAHYFEEVLPHAKTLASLGFRGDKYYIFYSRDKQGKAYYESNELRLSAHYYYQYFSDVANRAKYFRDVKSILQKVGRHIDDANSLNIASLSDAQLNDLFLKTYELDSIVFSYFLACQPQRTVLFEDGIKNELKKRVATERVDSYLAELAVSEKLTRMGEEGRDWLTLLISNHSVLKSAVEKMHKLQTEYPKLYSDLEEHFNKYKILSIGDGSWSYDIEFFMKHLLRDAAMPITQLRQKLAIVKGRAEQVLAARTRLASELYLPQDTIRTINFLADLGFYRFNLRVDGFMLLIMTGIGLSREVARRRGISKDAFAYLNINELQRFLDGTFSYTQEDAADRMGKHEEYMIYLADGQITTFYGEEAQMMFDRLVPAVNLSHIVEVSGSPAMRGVVRGRVCLYNWGDNMQDKLRSIKKNQILVAGHTRPAMMPLIREAIGIVTDEGGVTSHAAIVSRELGLPSVIGTRHATHVFKEGDLVELDADHGIVRKLS